MVRELNTGWRRRVVVSGVRRMNEVNARRALLVPGWVTVFGRVYHLGMCKDVTTPVHIFGFVHVKT